MPRNRGAAVCTKSSDRFRLAVERQELLQHLIDRRDNPRVAPIGRGSEDQIDQILADIGVGKLERTSRDRTDTCASRRAYHWQTRVDARRVVIVSERLQTFGIAES